MINSDPSNYELLMRNSDRYNLSQNKENLSSNWSYSQPKIDDSIGNTKHFYFQNPTSIYPKIIHTINELGRIYY